MSRILFQSALLAAPGTLLVAWLYGMWSSKKSMMLFGLATVVALAGFALVASVLAIPLLGSALMLAVKGIETKDRSLEEVASESVARVA